jgi:hypothetical protein
MPLIPGDLTRLIQLRETARQQMAEEAKKRDAIKADPAERNWDELLVAIKADLPFDMYPFADLEDIRPFFYGDTKRVTLRIKIPWHATICANYERHGSGWHRVEFDCYPKQPVDSYAGSSPLWLVRLPNNGCDYTHTPGAALVLAEITLPSDDVKHAD